MQTPDAVLVHAEIGRPAGEFDQNRTFQVRRTAGPQYVRPLPVSGRASFISQPKFPLTLQTEPTAGAGAPFLFDDSETGRSLRATDWSASPLGPPAAWSEALKVMVSTMLSSPQPMFLTWGPELTFLFNDAYRPILGRRLEGALGRPFAELWSDVWQDIEALVTKTLAGEGSRFEDMPLVVTRNGYTEDTWWSFSYTPVRDGAGVVHGMLCILSEKTAQVLANRKLAADREAMQRMFDQAPSFIAMLSGPKHVFDFVNPAFERLIGHRDVIGRTVEDALSDAVEQGYLELLDGVVRSGEAFTSYGARYAVQAEADGPLVERFVDFVYQPIRDESGVVTGIFVEGSDVTDRTLAQVALQDREQFLQSVLGSSSDCIKVLDLDANLVFMTEGGKKVMEVSDFNSIQGCPWPDFWQDQGNVDAKAAVAVAQAGGTGRFTGRANTMKGNPRWWDVQVTPILGPDGQPERLLSVSRDVTASREADGALREAQSLNTLILNSSRDCIVVMDLEGNNVFVSPGGIEVMEVTDVKAIIGLSWLRVWEGDDNAKARHAVAEARAGRTGRFQGYCPTKTGTPKWWDVVISPLGGSTGHPERIVSIARDITEQKLAEFHRSDLMREMSHRMKNTLSIVQAITSQTFRQIGTMQDASKAITGRLNALSEASDILMGETKSSSIVRVVETALAPHRSGEGRFLIYGPDVELSAEQGLGLSLALHELATNAAKYGALSSSQGRVEVRWSVGDDAHFRFEWIEHDGPAVEVPTRTGFGSKLVQRVVASYFNGDAKLAFEPQGASFRLDGRLAAQ